MKKGMMCFAVLLLSVYASAQEPLLIDTLTVDERKIVQDIYAERKKNIFCLPG